MSYQPYPTGGASQPYPAGGNEIGQRPPQPSSVRNAVRLMYAGGALSAITAILILATSSSIKNAVGRALRKANATDISNGKKPLTAAQILSVEKATIVVFVVVLVIAIGLWAWMAWANGRGRNWARIVATVLFALNTIDLVLSVSRAGLSVIFVALGWVIGLAAIILLWRRESSAYFQPNRIR
jgi:hypothetical protein